MTPDSGSSSATAAAGVDDGRRGGRRLGWLDALRGLFLVAAVGFGWWGLREYRTQIGAALSGTSPVRVLMSLVVVLGGLAVTGAVWRAILAAMGHRVPVRPASAIFFVGQLGKYIPGSVWSLGAQADMARRYDVPARTTVAVGLVFLWVHVVTALPVAALLGLLDEPTSGEVADPGPLAGWVADLPGWIVLVAVLLTVAAVSPGVMRRIARLLAGQHQPLRLAWTGSGRLLGLMAVVWLAYGVGLVLVLPPPALTQAGGVGAVLGTALAAFAAAYVLGVVLVVAPAGAAVRELTLIGLLAPLVGIGAAAAAAILVRVVHTVADFTIAGLSWLAARPGRAGEPARASGPDRASRRDDSADP